MFAPARAPKPEICLADTPLPANTEGVRVGVGGCDLLVTVGRGHLDRMLLFLRHGGTDNPFSRNDTSICPQTNSTSSTRRLCVPTKCTGRASISRRYLAVGRLMTKCAFISGSNTRISASSFCCDSWCSASPLLSPSSLPLLTVLGRLS